MCAGCAEASSRALGSARWSLHQMESNPSSSAIRPTASIVARSASVSWTFGTVTPMRMLAPVGAYAVEPAPAGAGTPLESSASAVATACAISVRSAGPRERQATTPSGRTSVAPPAERP